MRRTSLALAATALLLGGCAHNSELDETGGLKITRSTCPAVAVPAYTGDVTLFSPEQSHDARALDVVATITNLRTSCDESGSRCAATPRSTWSPVDRARMAPVTSCCRISSRSCAGARRSCRSRRAASRFTSTMGSCGGIGTAGAGAQVDKALATLPAVASEKLNRKRRATDADASIDPMSDPRIRSAVNQANFEVLIGFQLTQDQLAYNATR